MNADKLDKIKRDFINNSLTDFDAALKKFQAELLKFIQSEFLPQMKDGKLQYTAANFRDANIFTAKIDKFLQDLAPAFKEIATKMLETAQYSADYFSAVANVNATTQDIEARLKILSERIGIDYNRQFAGDGIRPRVGVVVWDA